MKTKINIYRGMIMFISLIGCAVNAAYAYSDPYVKDKAVVITEVMDYECPHCSNMQPILNTLAQNPNILVGYLPVASQNEQSLLEASYAISRNIYHHDFKKTHMDFMNKHFQSTNELISYIKKHGGNSENVISEMESQEVRAVFEDSYSVMDKFNIHETPLFIINTPNQKGNTTILVGEQSYESLQKAINYVIRRGVRA